MQKNPMLEELLIKWKIFIATSFAAFILGNYGGQYIQGVVYRWNNFDEKQERAEAGRLRLDDIDYRYLGADGFTLETTIGNVYYIFSFGGACRDNLHQYAHGNKIFLSKDGMQNISIYDENCDNVVDVVSSENGNCSTEADETSSYDSCSHNTYTESNALFDNALRLLHAREYAHEYYERRYNNLELPENQAERILKGFRKQAP